MKTGNDSKSISWDNISLIVSDFDGVLTDNFVYVGTDGAEYVKCNKSDFLYRIPLMVHGINIVVLTQESNACVAARCEKLGAPCYYSDFKNENKVDTLAEICNQYGVALENVCYIGNDLPDVECMEAAGCSVAPADAFPEARSAANVLWSKSGGEGLVRAVCGAIIGARWPHMTYGEFFNESMRRYREMKERAVCERKA